MLVRIDHNGAADAERVRIGPDSAAAAAPMTDADTPEPADKMRATKCGACLACPGLTRRLCWTANPDVRGRVTLASTLVKP